MNKHTHFLYIHISLVLLFVNTIAEIVHSRVHGWGGQCNKNLGKECTVCMYVCMDGQAHIIHVKILLQGNAFVIVWRIGDEKTLMEQTQGG